MGFYGRCSLLLKELFLSFFRGITIPLRNKEIVILTGITIHKNKFLSNKWIIISFHGFILRIKRDLKIHYQ